MIVSVLGGSLPKPGEPSYEEALRLGQLLGKAGHSVMTGGYIGAMEAASRGAAEVGAHVIGCTCDEIEAWREIAPNPWVKEEWRFPSLNERMLALLKRCDAAIALPGGLGTLAEIALLWNLQAVNVVPPNPLILVGSGWQDTFNTFFINLGTYVTEKDRHLLLFAADIEQAVTLLSGFKN